NAPAWTSIMPQIVSDAELPSAATLSGLQFNISGIIGPALGGLLVPLAGANFVFAINGACFLLVVVAARQWKQPALPAQLPSESFFESFGTIIRYARSAPGFQVVLARNFLFALFISVIPALMPVVGLKVLHLSSSNLGLLFTSMGAGSVVGAVFIIPWLRARFSPDSVTLSANLLLVLVYVLMAMVRQTEVFFVVAALAGVGWTMSASELWVAAQRAMPGWARGRMNATVIMVSQGAMALGGIIWGTIAAMAGVNTALIVVAVLVLAAPALTHLLGPPWSSDFTMTAEPDSVPVAVMNIVHSLLYRPEPKDGPVLVTVEFQVDRSRGSKFVELMREVRLIHLRNGAYSWQLFEDPSRL